MLKTDIVSSSATGHMVTAGWLLTFPLPTPYSLCPQQVPRLAVVLCLVGGPKPLFLKSLDHQQSCLNLLVEVIC